MKLVGFEQTGQKRPGLMGGWSSLLNLLSLAPDITSVTLGGCWAHYKIGHRIFPLIRGRCRSGALNGITSNSFVVDLGCKRCAIQPNVVNPGESVLFTKASTHGNHVYRKVMRSSIFFIEEYNLTRSKSTLFKKLGASFSEFFGTQAIFYIGFQYVANKTSRSY